MVAKKRIFIDSAGCTENIIDGAILKNIAEDHGYESTNDPKEADLIIFNSCAAKQKQEDLCIDRIKKYDEIKKTGAEIVVCGCLPEINKERLDRAFTGNSFAPHNLEKFYELIKDVSAEKIEEAHHITRDISDFEMFRKRALIERIYSVKKYLNKTLHVNFFPNFNLFDYIGDEKTLFVRISRGCLNKCGYCAIRFAQGRLVSQPMDSILASIKQGIMDGYNKVFLVATNASHYGKDIGTSFTKLLQYILDIDGEFKIIIHNFEPFGAQESPDELLRLLSSPKILSFYFPLNSASQFVLNRMRRNYDIDQTMGFLKKLRELNGNILIRTEFMVGYPGEKWKNFIETMSFVRKFRFNQIDLHRYSPRPNIPALELDGQVSPIVKYLRSFIIQAFVFFRVTIRMLRPF